MYKHVHFIVLMVIMRLLVVCISITSSLCHLGAIWEMEVGQHKGSAEGFYINVEALYRNINQPYFKTIVLNTIQYKMH